MFAQHHPRRMIAFAVHRPLLVAAALVALVLPVLPAGAAAALTCSADLCGSVNTAGVAKVQQTFQVTAAGTVTAILDWDNAGADLNIRLRDPAGTWTRATTSTTTKPETVVAVGGAAGTWTTEVSAASGAANYTIKLYHSGAKPPAPATGARLTSIFGFGPNSAGHAGIYPYGMKYEPSYATVLVGDVWNHRVLRYTAAGDRVSGFQITNAGPAGRVEPFDVDEDAAGNVWVANEALARVDEFTHAGVWIKSIGVNGSPGINYPLGCGNGSQHWPTNIAVDSANGMLYISDGFCGDISQFNANTGVFVKTFGMKPTDFGVPKLVPRGLDLDPQGNLVVAEKSSSRIAKYSPDGALLPGWPTAPITGLLDPRGVAVDQNGDIYTVAALYNEVFRFDQSGTLISRQTYAGTTKFNSIRYLTVNNGEVWVGDTWGYRIWHLSSAGAVLTWNAAPLPPPNGGFNQVSGIDLAEASGRLFAVDLYENRGQAFNTVNPAGGLWWCTSATNCPAYELSFGNRTTNMPSTDGFNYPRALGVGGNVVAADGGTSVVEHDLIGNFSGRFGSYGSAPGKFIEGPTGIDVVPTDATTGKIYTTDLGNCRIMVSAYDGTYLDQMGACGTGTDQMRAPWQIQVAGNRAYVVDSGRSAVFVWDLTTHHVVATYSGAFAGLNLSQPKGLAVDAAGKWLYISDGLNKRIVRVTLDGTNVRQLVTKGADTPEGSFSLTRYLAFGPDGSLYVSDFNQRVYAFTVAP